MNFFYLEWSYIVSNSCYYNNGIFKNRVTNKFSQGAWHTK